MCEKDYKLEKFEWENIWWESTDDLEHPRVLYIGDSISCGTRTAATAASGHTILFDGFGTSKGLDNPYFCDSIRRCIAQQPHCEAIVINNGLHGWHLSDSEYEFYYKKILDFLNNEYPELPIGIVLTTNVVNNPPGYDAERIKTRNKIAQTIANERNLSIIDLYSVSVSSNDHYSGDGVHFTDKGYKSLGEKMAEEVAKNLIKLKGIYYELDCKEGNF